MSYELLLLIAIVVVWLLLSRFVLPKMGVPT
jgi:hypothetical protein